MLEITSYLEKRNTKLKSLGQDSLRHGLQQKPVNIKGWILGFKWKSPFCGTNQRLFLYHSKTADSTNIDYCR